jgi:hypothetical protein
MKGNILKFKAKGTGMTSALLHLDWSKSGDSIVINTQAG